MELGFILKVLTCHFLLMTIIEVKGYEPRILALRLPSTDAKSYYTEDGQISIESGNPVDLEIIGTDLKNAMPVKLITEKMQKGLNCDDGNGSFPRLETPEKLLQLDGNLKLAGNEFVYSSTFYVCVEVNGTFRHQGYENKVLIQVRSPSFLPVWVNFIFLALLLCLSGLFSGLNLGLMSLDQTELQIVVTTGTESEKNNASTILPVRSHGNFLLCTLLFGNVLVNVLIPLLLDGIPGANGPIAVAGSTFGIVIFGEIIPQAVCSRHGLAVGAKTMFLTKFFMLLTFPLSYPISKILDCVLGEEIGTKYDRHRLMELLRVTGHETDLDAKEVNMLTGALVLKETSVKDVMTPIHDCFLLPLDSILNFDTISDIKTNGYSRIPVYEDERSNIQYILMAKDLLFVDPDDEKPLEEICKFYDKPFIKTKSQKPLDKMLEEFRTGERGHLAIVEEGDDNEVIGLVTLEDIIEEIIQAEIVDEDDPVIDNKSKKKRFREARYTKEKEMKMFPGLDPSDKQVEVPPQITLAVFQYLSSSIDKFSPAVMNQAVLKKLLALNVFRIAKLSINADSDSENDFIVRKGVPSDSFLLIVEGKVEVQIGTEGYIFESGPFTFFGKQALEIPDDSHCVSKKITWTPECNIKPRGEVVYLAIRSGTYWAAVQASKRESNARPEEMEKQIQIMIKEQEEPDLHEEATLLNT